MDLKDIHNSSQDRLHFFTEDCKPGLRCSPDLGCFEFKKCCKKYKRGKRCKKCPDR